MYSILGGYFGSGFGVQYIFTLRVEITEWNHSEVISDVVINGPLVELSARHSALMRLSPIITSLVMT